MSEIERYRQCFDEIQTPENTHKMVMDRIQREYGHAKNTVHRRTMWAMPTAIAAVACIVAIIGQLIMPDSANAFSIRAYALDLSEDGTVLLREAELSDQNRFWGGYFYGENYYASLGFSFEGENVKSVQFTTDDGFFAKQRISHSNEDSRILRMYMGVDHQLVVIGGGFENMGNRITLDDKTNSKNLLLFWGTRANGIGEIPAKPKITAKATFDNGEVREIPITINLSGIGVVKSGNDAALYGNDCDKSD